MSEKNSHSEHQIPVEFVEKVTQAIDGGELVVFCGAGISINSGIPAVAFFVPYILEKLGAPKEEAEKIINSNLPFEAFMETLRDGSDASRFFDIYDLGQPNPTHIFLAKLAKQGYLRTICTANFDHLIEDALKNEGVEYDLFYKEEEFEGINWDKKKVRLIKIHGSISDRENMVVTLSRVAQQDRSAARQSVIEHLFQEGTPLAPCNDWTKVCGK